MERRVESVTTAEGVLEHLRQLVAGATEELAVSVPADLLGRVEDDLRGAIDRDVLVLLLVTGRHAGQRSPLDLDGIATVARRWEAYPPVAVAVDTSQGMFAPGSFVASGSSEMPASVFADPALAHILIEGFFGNYWVSGAEIHAADPDPLGATYENFRAAAVQATLRLRDHQRIDARIRGRPIADPTDDASTDEPPVEEIDGQLVNVRQSFVYPITSSFPAETSLTLRTRDGLVTVGGWGAFVEDYEAESVTIEST